MRPSHCPKKHSRTMERPSWQAALVPRLAVVLAILYLPACSQVPSKSATVDRRPKWSRPAREMLLNALMVAGGYTSDPYFRPRKPIVRNLWDYATGKRTTIAVLISGGPNVDLKGMVAVIRHRSRVLADLKIQGVTRFIRTVSINRLNGAPDSVLLCGTNGWNADGSIETYHLITLIDKHLVRTFSVTGRVTNSVLGTPPVRRITSLIPAHLLSGEFNSLCLFSMSFGSRPENSAELWRWDPTTLHFVPFSKQDIASVNSDVLKWARGVKWKMAGTRKGDIHR